MRLLSGIAVVAISLVACTDSSGELKGPEAEVKATNVELKMPSVPKFDIPEKSGGTHSVREMRLTGGSLLDTEVKVKGYVTWIYDCVATLIGPTLTKAQVEKMIADQPSKCLRPHLYLGHSPDAPASKSIWVVEVPRKLRPDEKRNLTRAELAALPKIPEISVGDEVVVVGKWTQRSPHGFAQTNGLLVYKDLQNLTKEAAGTPPPAPAPQ